MKNLFLLATLATLICFTSTSMATNVNGTLNTDTTWTLENSPYIVTSGLTLNQGKKLTIQSGVIVKFDPGVSFSVYGRINATNVTFTSNASSPTNGAWGNISFGTGSNVDTSFFTGCIFQWGSSISMSNQYAVTFNGSNISRFSGSPLYISSGAAVYLNNTGVANCNYSIALSGLLNCSNSTTIFNVGGTSYAAIDNNSGNLVLSNTTIQSCAYPINLGSQDASLSISGTTDLLSNTKAAIIVSYGTINGTRNVSYPTANVPYIIQYGMTIEAGSRLTIGENNIIKFNYGGMNVYGTLVANASLGKNIYFTSLRDDNWGGDSNNDAGATAPGRSNWSSIKFYNSSIDANCLLRRVKIRYADKGVETDDASPTLDSCDFSINNYGLSMLNASSPTVTNCTFASAAYTPIAMSFEADPVFNNNSFSFSDNQYDAIGLYGGTLTANARVKARSVTSYPNVTYVMLNNITVPSDKTLTIDPGVVIKCISWGSSVFIVNGKMIAEGTSTSPIVVTSVKDDNYGQPQDTNKDGSSSSPNKGDFASFCFFQGSTGNSFKYCKVRYSNGWNGQSYEFNSAAFNFINANGTIQNCEIKDNENGINCFLASNPTIQDNDFANLSFAVTLSAAANPTLIGNTLTNVGYRALGLVGVGFNYNTELTVSGTIKQKNFAGYNNITYVLRNHLYIANGTNISVDSGVVIKGLGYGVTCKGGFRINGTAANPVIFTSIKDDNQGNPMDTNGDGNGSTPNVGEAPGIYFGPTSDDSYCRLYYMRHYYGGIPWGAYEYPTYGVIHVESANPVIDRILMTNLPSDRVAIGIFGNSAPAISNTTFSNGSYLPVSMSLVSNPTFTNITLTSMGYTAILINDANLNTNATLNPRNFAGFSNIAYFMNQCLTINTGSKLTINPGVVIKYQSNNACISVRGALNIAGTSSNKVIFTQGSDDSAGGDSNNNGNGSTPGNDLFGITFEDESDDTQNSINYLDMRFAGGYRYSREALRFFNASAVVQNSSFNFGDIPFGIFGTSAPSFQNINISNYQVPVRLHMFSNPTFGTISCNNIGYMVFVINDATYTQNATFPLRNFAGYNNITYAIDGTQTINSGTTITIPAGMTFKSSSYGFYVQGRINVEGTASSPVVFTVIADDSYGSPADVQNDGNSTVPNIRGGNWIHFPDVADDSSNVNYAIFRYIDYPINCNSSSPTIKNCSFVNCNYGIYMNGTSAPVVENNLFHNLTRTPINTSILSYPSSATGNSMSGTTWKAISILDETLSQDVTLAKRSFGGLSNIPYCFTSFTVGTTATLTIAPGVTTKWNGWLYIQKGLNAIGGATSDSNIVFTSYRDDFYGGDMNSDSTATSPDPNYYGWGGIQFQDVSIDPLCKMKNCIILYSSAGVVMNNASPDIQHCAFVSGSYGNAVTANGSSNPTVNYCDFYITPYYGNYHGVYNTNQSFLINAENNWWGSNNGPSHSGNASGTGTKSTDAVDYLPFRNNGPNRPLTGDVSQNGTVQAYDAALILQSLVNTITLTPSQENSADVSGNGSVSALDASQILQFSVGLINYFNAEAYIRSSQNSQTHLALAHQTGNKGDLVAIPFRFNEVDNLYGMLTKIQFDTTFLSFDHIEFSDNGMNHASNCPVNGTLLFTLAGANPLQTDGIAGVIYIRIKDNAPEGVDIPLTIKSCNINDADRTNASVHGMISTNRSINPMNTESNMISMYPVPAINQVTLQINREALDGNVFNYTISDMNGKKLIQRSATVADLNNQFVSVNINISNFTSGVYQLTYTSKGKTYGKKFNIVK